MVSCISCLTGSFCLSQDEDRATGLCEVREGKVISKKVNGYCLCCGFSIYDSLVEKLALKFV